MTLDGSNTKKEHIEGILDNDTKVMSEIESISRQGVRTTGLARDHKIGCSVEHTDFGTLLFLNNMLKGEIPLDGDTPLEYDEQPTLSEDNQLATVKYVNDSASAGGVNASSIAKGISFLSVDPEDADTPIALGENDPRVPTIDQIGAMSGTSGSLPSATNPFIDQGSLSDGNALDQSQDVSDMSVPFGQANATTKYNKVNQSFVAGKSPVDNIKLYKQANTGTFTGDVIVSIQTDTAGNPSGTSIGSLTIANATYNALPVGEFTVQFVSNVPINIGQTYHIVVEATTADNSNYPSVGANSAGGYASGSVKFNNTTDGWTAIATIDLYFKIIIDLTGKIPLLNSDGTLPEDVISQEVIGNVFAFNSGEDLVQNDEVYPSLNDFVKRYRPIGITTATGAATNNVKGGQNTSKAFMADTTHLFCIDFMNSANNVRYIPINPLTGAGTSEAATQYTTGSRTSNYGDACSFLPDKYLIFWQDNNGGVAGGIKARVVTTTGGTVTMGTIATVETTGALSSQVSCTALDATRALISYKRDSDNELVVRIITISGTTITLNTDYIIPRVDLSTSTRVSVQKIDTDKVMIIWQSNSSSGTNTIKSMVLSVSGTVITQGTAVSISNNTSSNTSIFDIGQQFVETDKVLAVFEVSGGGSGNPDKNLTAKVLSVSGTTVTFGTDFTVEAVPSSFGGGIYQGYTFTPSVVAVPFQNSGGGVSILEIEGTTITQISKTSVSGSGGPISNPIGVCAIRTGVFKLQTGMFGDSFGQYITLTQPTSKRIGVATETSDSGNVNHIILLYRLLSTFSGLVVASDYYINDNGQPTTEMSNTAVQYGTAINTTTMLLK